MEVQEELRIVDLRLLWPWQTPMRLRNVDVELTIVEDHVFPGVPHPGESRLGEVLLAGVGSGLSVMAEAIVRWFLAHPLYRNANGPGSYPRPINNFPRLEVDNNGHRGLSSP